MTELRANLEEAEKNKKEKEALKIADEEKEAAALEKYKVPEPVQPEPVETVDPVTEAKEFFAKLDADGSHSLTIDELQLGPNKHIFDKDEDGTVSDEEAMDFLNHKENLPMEEFLVSVWPNVKSSMMHKQGRDETFTWSTYRISR